MKSVAGAGVVITGAGSGIGAALARRFAAEGARVVINDIDAAAAQQVAKSCGGEALPGDAASEAGVAGLISGAADLLDGIDLFCANAGIARAGAGDAAEPDWDASWQVNVMAHVRAARELLPGWLARGRGHFLATVSAAGLSTNLGAARMRSANTARWRSPSGWPRPTATAASPSSACARKPYGPLYTTTAPPSAKPRSPARTRRRGPRRPPFPDPAAPRNSPGTHQSDDTCPSRRALPCDPSTRSPRPEGRPS